MLSQQQLEQALFAQRKDGRRLGQLLIELGLVGETKLTQTLSRQLSVPWVSLYHVDFSRSLLNLVPRVVAEKYSLVPIFVRRVRNQGETLYVAMDDPTRDEAIDEVTRASSMPVKPMIACPTDIRAAIRVYYLGESVPEAPPPSQIAAPQASPLNHSGQRNVSLSAVAAPLRPIRGQGAVEAHSGVTQNPGMPQEGGTGAATAPDGSPPRRIRPRMISAYSPRRDHSFGTRTQAAWLQARRGPARRRRAERSADGARLGQRASRGRARRGRERNSRDRTAVGGDVLRAAFDPPPKRAHRGLGVHRGVPEDSEKDPHRGARRDVRSLE